MLSFAQSRNEMVGNRFRNLFRPRDLFLHDGASLRRFRIGVSAQITLAAIALASLAAMVMVLTQMTSQSSVRSAEVVRMQHQVAGMQDAVVELRQAARTHAARLEARQAFLAAVLSGKADGAALAAMLPERAGGQAHGAVAEIVSPLVALEDDQLAFADTLRKATDARYKSTAAALRRLGIDPQQLARGPALGQGGPYEPVPLGAAVPLAKADPKFKSLFLSWKKLDQVQQGVVAVPSAKPIESKVAFTSSFGIRSDPFRGGAAMHAGIDLAGPIGTPIYATADAVVGRAQWANGYGKLIELEHGKGIQTRYGHLSEILVKANTRVKRGDLIGRMGSTGRSTGSHLHYEVRIDGRAVNPLPFIQSADYLLALQQRSAPVVHASMGGPDRQ